MFSFSLESIYITMNSIRPPQHPRQEEAGEVQGEVGPQLRKFLKNLGCQKCILTIQEPAHPLASSGPESLSPGHSAPIPRLTQATPASVARLLRSVLEKPHPLVENSLFSSLQPQRYRSGQNANKRLDHQSSYSLGGETAETSPRGGDQQKVKVRFRVRFMEL